MFCIDHEASSFGLSFLELVCILFVELVRNRYGFKLLFVEHFFDVIIFLLYLSLFEGLAFFSLSPEDVVFPLNGPAQVRAKDQKDWHDGGVSILLDFEVSGSFGLFLIEEFDDGSQ